MKDSRDKLTQLLKQVEIPDDLEMQLHNQLQAAVRNEKRKRYLLPVSLAASVVMTMAVVLVVGLKPNKAEELIAYAFAHAQEEQPVQGILDIKFDDWLQQEKINFRPQQHNIELVKFCVVDGKAARHLRVASRQGDVNLFIFAQAQLNNTQEGLISGNTWKVFTLASGKQVLAFFNQDTSSDQVNNIIQSVFTT